MSTIPSILRTRISSSKRKVSNKQDFEFPTTIPVVDLFAGPGGLGEGFSSVSEDPFRIIVSAEMNSAAHSTLRLRAFYRILKRRGGDALNRYYEFCNGIVAEFTDESTCDAWEEACDEALRLELGKAEDNSVLDARLNDFQLGPDVPWVLIGGPPCQAYSLVGRSRNRGKIAYKAEEDHRHFLYKEYLRIIQKYRPAVFVMENVKGILSAKVGDNRIFETILHDLADPDHALGASRSGPGYRIHSLTSETSFSAGDNPALIDVQDFVIKAERHGVPQARHRVILVGVRTDISSSPDQLAISPEVTVSDAIGVLPALRSRLSRQKDCSLAWADIVKVHFAELSKEAESSEDLQRLANTLNISACEVRFDMSTGGPRILASQGSQSGVLDYWLKDERVTHWLNHESRAHMSEDLRRYAFAAAFAKTFARSPKGHGEFSLSRLRPNHENWESGKFADRFKVQVGDRPATTVTSHISKDGHYFIHYDPAQCRSLTVREAARLQTFPDNYFFMGSRTEQFHQVGNAVPPLLAKQIAEIVHKLLRNKATNRVKSTKGQRELFSPKLEAVEEM